MIDKIGGLGPLRGAVGPGTGGEAGARGGRAVVQEILQDSIQSVDHLQKEADQVLERYTKGEVSQDQVMVAFKKGADRV
jgi:flagellar hook-basal body complex protein FliE